MIQNQDFPKIAKSRLLIHIAFHFVESRLQYLYKVLEAINQYDFFHIDVVVDTNSNQLESYSSQIKKFDKFNFRIKSHENLKDPFSLTWMHRIQIENQISNYDYFMYIEDDIEVRFKTIERWHDDSILLNKDKYLRGFLRIEKNHDGNIFYTDQIKRMKYKNFLRHRNKNYFYPSNPYQGFWIYSQAQMNTFRSSPCWNDGNYPNWEIRERASSGMIWLERNRHRVLIPLSDTLEIPDNVLVHHLPNNYVLDPKSNFGSISRSKLTRSSFVMKFYREMSKLRNK